MKAKRAIRTMMVALLAVVLAGSVTACGNKTTAQANDTEKRPLSMSISTPDGVFNPFFSTSAYDNEIISMTQIQMLGTDKSGSIVWGDDEAVVVKDMRETTYTEGGKRYTRYEFIIKNGIKFSDGTPLTIKDVLFNLYTYLDICYAGSSTIYSTDIVGLKQYRMQDDSADISDNAYDAFEERFADEAATRIDDLIDYVYRNAYARAEDKADHSSSFDDANLSAEQKAAFLADFDYVKEEFAKELEADWNSTIANMESYDDWGFTEPWQVFLLNDGGDTSLLLKKDGTNSFFKDEQGNYKLDAEYAETLALDYEDYLADNPGKTEKDWAISSVFDGYFPAAFASTHADQFESILRGWATGDTVQSRFVNDAKTAAFAGQTRKVPTVSGIDGTKTTSVDFSGKALGAEHDVLTITINDVDPKAIYNFAFTVAPMNYYSTTNYYKNGKNYIQAFNQATGNFGLEPSDIDFMNDVINAPEKVNLPKGAGPYMASDESGNIASSGAKFYDKGMIYFQRNPYFETTGANIQNAKIKYFTYKVVETDQIINSIAGGNIDVGTPNATQPNIAALNSAGVRHIELETSGYGYVGINPRFVPDINVRRAIMKAMNTSIIKDNYYQGDLCEIITRPMSKTSWAYPEGAPVFKKDGLDYSYDSTGASIKQMIEDAGYTLNSEGLYHKQIKGFGDDVLDYKFTIAGATTDHPAYSMFLNAADILENKVGGIRIKVEPNANALSDLATGKLAVWAAAWSSTIDPDMYQIYHKDSTATSVNNWGYKQIKAKKYDGPYATEWGLILEISDLIDEGRETTDRAARTEIYHDALDLIMELAVEFPTYQRNDMTAFNANIIDESTLVPANERSAYVGPFSRIWEVNYR